MTAPSAQITPTGITCSQFVGGTAPTLSNFTYAVSNGIIANDQPGVFFYYDRITLKTGANTITINEIVKSGQGDNYLLHILNDSTSQVNLFDNNCNVIGSATVTFNTANHTYTVTITVNISGTPAPFYVISAKYTPKTIVDQIPTWTQADLGVDENLVGLRGSPTIVRVVEPIPAAPSERKALVLDGRKEEDVQEAAKIIVQKMGGA